MKKILSALLFLTIVSACSNDHTHYNSTQDTHASYGVKPIIYYHGKHYKIFNKRNKLPQGYTDSGDKIIGSEIDADKIPNRECYTSKFNADHVGAKIFSNPIDDSYIYINIEDGFLAFQLETNSE